MIIRRLANWLRDDTAAVAPILALAIIPIIGMFALGGEVAGWYMKQRQLQNAADSAALAAAANASTGYSAEAKGVTTQYGFLDDVGANDLDITKTNTATCPGTSSNTCYQVTIVQKVPLYMTQIVGYTGGGTVMADGRKATLIRATSIATKGTAVNYCMIGLGTGGNAGPGGGSNNVSLAGNGNGFDECGAVSNGQVKCTAVDFAIVQAPSQQGGTCGSDYSQTTTTFTDPYASKGYSALIAAAISGTSCYSGALTGTIIASVVKICSSNRTLTGNMTFQSPNSTPPILVIYDTTVIKGAYSISTTSGVGATGGTVIVTGAGTTNNNAWFSGTGDVNIQGANGGSFDDIALLVDPKHTTTANYDPGSSAHADLHALGTLYAPNTNMVIQGSMDATVGAYKCISIVAKSIYVNGGSMDNDPLNCKALGFNLSESQVGRQALVQ